MPNQTLETNLNYLKLSYIKENYNQLTSIAAKKKFSHIDFLENIIAAEVISKQDKASIRRVKQAYFPYIKTLDAFNWAHPKKINRDLVKHLFGLGFLDNNSNVAFLGGPGMGKSHLSIALAYHACLKGFRVRFDTAINIINKLDEAQKNGKLNQTMKTYLAPKILVVDEIGYLPIDQRGADLLFQVISSRYERGSIIFSSNRAFSDWAIIFNNDSTITSAILDRILHRCEVIVIEGNSYRMKNRKTQ